MGPYIVEFAGMPNSGKTTSIDLVADYFRRLGHTVRVISERAQVCPFSASYRRRFAEWMVCQAAQTVLEASRSDDEDALILVDRGIFDSIVFLELLYLEERIGQENRDQLLRKSHVMSLASRVNLIFLFTVEPGTALSRDLITRHFGLEGTITNYPTLEKLAAAYRRILARCQGQFREVRPIATDAITPPEVVRQVLSHIESFLASVQNQRGQPAHYGQNDSWSPAQTEVPCGDKDQANLDVSTFVPSSVGQALRGKPST